MRLHLLHRFPLMTFENYMMTRDIMGRDVCSIVADGSKFPHVWAQWRYGQRAFALATKEGITLHV